MSSPARWHVMFDDGTETEVSAAGKRLAQAKACVQQNRSQDSIISLTIIQGKVRNGKTPHHRSRRRHTRDRYDDYRYRY